MPRAWIDVSTTLRAGMAQWPGDPPFRLERFLDLERRDPCTASHLAMSAHSGTHVDAPLHFVRGGAGIDAMPLDATIGPARVVAVEDAEMIGADELARHRPRRGERLLVKTRNSPQCWASDAFVPDFVALTAGAARLLTAAGVRAVGVDYLSVGAFAGDGDETHRILLGAGVWVIEGLDLTGVAPGRYDLVCLPLRLAGADGAPARALLRPRR